MVKPAPYVCTLLNAQGKPMGTLELPVETDAEAVAQGQIARRVHFGCLGCEVHAGDRLVYRLAVEL